MKRALNSLLYAELKLLSDTVNHFNNSNRSVTEGTCLYVCKDGTSEGCAIGRLMTEGEKEILLREGYIEDYNGESLDEIIEFFGVPQKVFGYRFEFLIELQNLHDSNLYWDDKGPTEEGWTRIGEMRASILSNKYGYSGDPISRARYPEFSAQ